MDFYSLRMREDNESKHHIDGTLDRPDIEEQESLCYRSQRLCDDIGNFWVDGS